MSHWEKQYLLPTAESAPVHTKHSKNPGGVARVRVEDQKKQKVTEDAAIRHGIYSMNSR